MKLCLSALSVVAWVVLAAPAFRLVSPHSEMMVDVPDAGGKV